MAFRDVNPKKLSYLLVHGTHEGELRKFFVDSRAQLLLKGAKIQNLPYGREKRIRTICDRLPPKTDDVFRTWFHQNIVLSDPMALTDVVTFLEWQFEEGTPIPNEDAKIVARSTLVYLCADEVDRELLSFLRRAPGVNHDSDTEESGGAPAHESDVESDHAKGAASAEEQALRGKHLAELLSAVISQDKGAVDSALVPFPDSTKALVEALFSIKDDNVEGASAQLKLLSSDSSEAILLQKALSRARHQRGASSLPTGVRVAHPEALRFVPELDAYDVIGICTNASDAGLIFVRPLFLVTEGKPFTLSPDDRVRLFPLSGDVMGYRTAVRRFPGRRDILRWTVAEREGAEGNIRFHLRTDASPLFEVIRLPVPSTDPDEVRNQVKAWASSARQASSRQPIFLLSDGVAVASPKLSDITRDEAFEQPWQAWTYLETWLIEGRQYCLDTSQSTASQLDLSSLDAAFKKLIRNLEADQKSTLNKGQVRELAELIRTNTAGEVGLRAKRIAKFLDQVALDADALDSVLGLLNLRSEVKARVDELVAKEAEERQAEKSGIVAEIESLKRRRDELTKEGRELDRNNRKRADSVSSAVKEAFSKAVSAGVSTMANAEIFRALSTPAINVPTEVSERTPSDVLEYWTSRDSLSFEQVKPRLVALGLNNRQAIALSLLWTLTKQCGVGLILSGRRARQYVQILARQDCPLTGHIEIPMSLTSSGPIRRTMTSLSEAGTIAVLNADLSPFEAYGCRILDALYDSASTGSHETHFLFSLAGGELALPVPSALRTVCIAVDLDSQWDKGTQRIDELEEGAVPLLAPARKNVFERCGSLGVGDKELLESVLATAFLSGQAKGP